MQHATLHFTGNISQTGTQQGLPEIATGLKPYLKHLPPGNGMLIFIVSLQHEHFGCHHYKE